MSFKINYNTFRQAGYGRLASVMNAREALKTQGRQAPKKMPGVDIMSGVIENGTPYVGTQMKALEALFSRGPQFRFQALSAFGGQLVLLPAVEEGKLQLFREAWEKGPFIASRTVENGSKYASTVDLVTASRGIISQFGRILQWLRGH